MTTKLKSLKIHSYGRSETGLVRENNEDAWLADSKNNVYILCDGMGGHTAGEVASQETVALFADRIKKHFNGRGSKGCTQFRELIKDINSSIYQLGQNDGELRGMGTTLCSVYYLQESMLVGHVGDSRVYLFRDGDLNQITEDHSLLSELIELGELNHRQAKEFSQRNIITRAIGVESQVDPSVQSFDLKGGDRVLMCSDGLTDMLSRYEIGRILSKELPVKQTVDLLIQQAIIKGGNDNITVILMQVDASHE